MDEHLDFQDLIQACLIHKAEVGDDNVSICKTIGKDKKDIISIEQYKLKKISGTSTKKEKRRKALKR